MQHSSLQEQQSHPRDILDDYRTRRAMAKTFAGFCLVYLSHYLQLPPGEFHSELLGSLSDHNLRFLEIIGFRGGTKSTFASLALPLWASLEHPDLFPFIIPVADTSQQAALNVAAIKYELEYNRIILQDYGKFEITGPEDESPDLRKDGDPLEDLSLESEEEWQAKNMLLSNGVRILARSRGQKIRGLRHRQHRPKLVLIDDPEDLKWVKNQDNRNTTEKWLRGEVLPAIDERTGRVVLIGNWLHEDALMARMANSGIFKVLRIPLIKSGDGPEIDRCTWKAKFPTQEAIDRQKQIVGEIAWMREYLLKVIPDEGAVIKPEWIQYYDREPNDVVVGLKGTGVDLAISKKDSADYTTMVSGKTFNTESRPLIYIQPNPINSHLSLHETVQTASAISRSFGGLFFVESVGYQLAAIQEMERNMIPVIPKKVSTDKRARLQTVAPYIQNGTVRFPRTGCEDLLLQLLGFGVEEHDDLVDAFVHLVQGLVDQGLEMPDVIDLSV